MTRGLNRTKYAWSSSSCSHATRSRSSTSPAASQPSSMSPGRLSIRSYDAAMAWRSLTEEGASTTRARQTRGRTAALRIPVKVISDSGLNVISDSGQSDHRSERSDAGVAVKVLRVRDESSRGDESSRIGAIARSQRLETESCFGRPRNVARCRRRSEPARIRRSRLWRARARSTHSDAACGSSAVRFA